MSVIPVQLPRRKQFWPMDKPVTVSGRGGPRVLTIPVHRNFADALANGLISMHGRDPLGLARGMILLPNNRAVRAITDAFVRRAEPGLLMPRLVPIGDVGSDAMGVALDPAGGEAVPAAIDPLVRRMIMARTVQQVRAETGARVDAAEALRLATELASTLDTLLAEDIPANALQKLDIAADLSLHWQKSLDLFATVIERWPAALASMRRLDLPERRLVLGPDGFLGVPVVRRDPFESVLGLEDCVGYELARVLIGEAIEHPGALASGRDDASQAQFRQML